MIEIMIGTIAFTTLIGVAFYGGIRFADHYAGRQERAVNYALKKQYARLVARADADDPCQPYVSPDETDG